MAGGAIAILGYSARSLAVWATAATTVITAIFSRSYSGYHTPSPFRLRWQYHLIRETIIVFTHPFVIIKNDIHQKSESHEEDNRSTWQCQGFDVCRHAKASSAGYSFGAEKSRMGSDTALPRLATPTSSPTMRAVNTLSRWHLMCNQPSTLQPEPTGERHDPPFIDTYYLAARSPGTAEMITCLSRTTAQTRGAQPCRRMPVRRSDQHTDDRWPLDTDPEEPDIQETPQKILSADLTLLLSTVRRLPAIREPDHAGSS